MKLLFITHQFYPVVGGIEVNSYGIAHLYLNKALLNFTDSLMASVRK